MFAFLDSVMHHAMIRLTSHLPYQEKIFESFLCKNLCTIPFCYLHNFIKINTQQQKRNRIASEGFIPVFLQCTSEWKVHLPFAFSLFINSLW